jgi:hypothetical protein
MATPALAGCDLRAFTAEKPAHGHGHGHGRKSEKKKGFWRELRHGDFSCCVGWAVYAPWACYMGLWILCVSSLAKCPLICLADLAGDPVLVPELRATVLLS